MIDLKNFKLTSNHAVIALVLTIIVLLLARGGNGPQVVTVGPDSTSAGKIDSLTKTIQILSDRVIALSNNGTQVIIQKPPEAHVTIIPGKPETTWVYNSTTKGTTMVVIQKPPDIQIQQRGWCLIPEVYGGFDTRAKYRIGGRLKFMFNRKWNWGVVGTQSYSGIAPAYHLTPNVEATFGVGWLYKGPPCAFGGVSIPLR
jgi:hypothetical protein